MDTLVNEAIAADDAPDASLEIRAQSIRSKIVSVVALIALAILANIGGWLPGRAGVNMQPLASLAPWSEHDELRETVGNDHLLHEIAIVHYTAERLRALREEPPVSQGLLEFDPARRVISGPRVQWISSQGLGRPGVAMPGFALLSSATWIHVVLPPRWSWTVWGTAQLLVAGLGAWLLAGRYVPAPGPRFVAGATYMLCGLHVTWMHGAMSAAAIWLPWCVIATLRVIHSPTLLRAAALALVLALQFAAGNAPTALGSIATCLILLFARTNRRLVLPAFLGFLLSLTVALLMTGLHWLPWWEYVMDVESMSPSTWMTPVSHQLTQAVALTTSMFAISAVALAAIAVRRQWNNRDVRLWFVILAVIAACAWILQLTAWIQPSWIWSIILSDVGLLAGPALGLAILAAVGLEAVSSEHRAISIWNPLVMAGAAAILALALLSSTASFAGAWPDRLVIASAARLGIATLLAFAVALLARRGAAAVPGRALMIALPAELIVFAIIANLGSGSSGVFPSTPEIEYLQQSTGRIDGPRLALPPNLAAVYGLDDARSSGQLAPSAAVVFGRAFDSDDDPRVALVDIRHRLETRSGEASTTAPATQPGVREVSSAPPRAWVARGARILPTREDVLLALASTPLDPAQPLIDQEIAPETRRVLDDELARNANWWKRESRHSSSAEYERISPEEIRVRVRGGGGWLIIADQYAPGWHAYVAGRESPVVRAYGAFIAVGVPNGNVDVVLRYVPRSGQRGMYASFGGVLALLMLVSLGLLPRFSDDRPRTSTLGRE